MTTLDRIEELAQKEPPDTSVLIANAEAVEEQAALLLGQDCQLMLDLAGKIRACALYIAALSPEVVLAMVDCIRAAAYVEQAYSNRHSPQHRANALYDLRGELAKLEQMK